MGCGGKLGWSKLSDDELSPCERETCPCVWRTMRILKHTIVGAVPSGGKKQFFFLSGGDGR